MLSSCFGRRQCVLTVMRSARIARSSAPVRRMACYTTCQYDTRSPSPISSRTRGTTPVTHQLRHYTKTSPKHSIDKPIQTPLLNPLDPQVPIPQDSTQPVPPLQPYKPPTTGLISKLPPSWIPYAELIRLNKPTGTYYLFFPCLFSTLLAAPLTTPIAPLPTVLGYSALFLTGALVMRGAGCTINDLWDRNLDPHVARTRHRPIARGAVSVRQAVVFTGAQLLTGLGVLVSFPTQCLYYGVPSLFFVAIYPLMKRITHYPQFVLGLTFSWGAMMGFPALGIDLLNNIVALKAAALLYTSCVSWTILYDMIYAHMDIKDDVKAGIKSIALAHEANTKAVLTGLAVVQVGLLGAAGVVVGAGPIFFVGSCGSAVVTLGTMIYRVDLKSVKNCWWWFVNGCLMTGGGISLGLFAEYIAQMKGVYESKPVERVERIEA